ncbi:uncharacterized protein BDR25DRAFT_350539 [Lindgomyces ingoldianus]|uniref:Uncharacterized protein n=1 Tax=Lindgomyces ingoldianus TaxID=673940 RepID=A0ACB6R745_9PLEO|nr:uncharacterized protein BDR25DRAFT_350539 [Lindgomyces ingoldianus]KAF2475128.1 hypothetical protein BDR25DRAFT_350539 [Lindgomyces ingoldianus]
MEYSLVKTELLEILDLFPRLPGIFYATQLLDDTALLEDRYDVGNCKGSTLESVLQVERTVPFAAKNTVLPAPLPIVLKKTYSFGRFSSPLEFTGDIGKAVDWNMETRILIPQGFLSPEFPVVSEIGFRATPAARIFSLYNSGAARRVGSCSLLAYPPPIGWRGPPEGDEL